MNYYKVKWMTQDLLKEVFTYDQTSGKFIWKEDRPVNHFSTVTGYRVYLKQRAGKVAGTNYASGTENRQAVSITILGECKRFKIHKLVFLYHYGYVPEYIDHIDGDYHNNRIENLQTISSSLNTAKAGMFSHNTSGYRGCRYREREDCWIVNLKVNKHGYYLGQYKDLQYAAAVYNKFAKIIFGDCAYVNDTAIDLTEVVIDNIFTRKHLPEILKHSGFTYVN